MLLSDWPALLPIILTLCVYPLMSRLSIKEAHGATAGAKLGAAAAEELRIKQHVSG